ncbi:uncharacterized mitochondrial protein-like protein [Tanacetum coccineum]
MNKLVKGNLVRGLPSKLFENDQTCVACQKGKQHRASCKSKIENSISLPLHLLHMDLFGLTFVKSLMKKMYCLVVTDDFSRFTWVFFLATKDETSGILKSFITGIENLVDHKVKVIRCDNGTEFKNKEMNQFCEMKGILRQYSVARTPQQNGVAERRNRTLIEAARTMLADSKLPTTFWTEAVNTAYYVQNRVSFGKFDGKVAEVSLFGYYLNIKAFRVFNSKTRISEKNLHIRFSESTPNVVGSGLDWLFDIDALTKKMNYEPIVAGTQSNGFADTKASDNAGQARKETEHVKNYILLPLWPADLPYSQDPKSSQDDGSKPSSDDGKKVDEDSRKDSEGIDQEKEDNVNSTNNVNAASTNEVNVVGKTSIKLPLIQICINWKIIAYLKMIKMLVQRLTCTIWIQQSKKNPKGDYALKDPRLCVYQMDVKSAFLYEKIEEEVKAWYETLSTYLLDNEFQRGKINKTLFIKRYKGDILLVQVYVDDIIFGSTKKELCNAFEKLMHEKFQMSSMGELTFFLGLQVEQKKDGIFISQDKCIGEILKKFRFTEVKTASTPIETQKPLLKDENGEEVDVHMYRSMIGSLMYLTSSRPDIMFAVCACARYQVNPKVSHLHAVKRIFRYLKGQPKLGLWYPKDSLFDLVAYTDSDYAGASLDRKSTTGGCQFLRCRLISWQCKKQTVVANSTTEAEYVAASSCSEGFEQIVDFLNAHPIKHALTVNPTIYTSCIEQFWANVKAKTVNGEGKVQYSGWTKLIIMNQLVRRDFNWKIAERRPKKKDTQVPQSSVPSDNVADEAVYKELDDSLVRAATTASSLEAEQDSGNIIKTRSKATPNEVGSHGTTSGGGLSSKVLDLETTKTTQANEIASLKMRVKKLEKKDRSRTHKLKRLYKVGLSAKVESSRDEEDLVNDDNEIFDVDALAGEEVFVAEQSGNVVGEVVAVIDAASTIPVSAATITDVEITLAQALAELKSAKPKADKVVIQEPEQGTTYTNLITIIPCTQNFQDKGKGIMIEEPMVEQVKPMKRLEQMRLDEELAFKLQAEEEEGKACNEEKSSTN